MQPSGKNGGGHVVATSIHFECSGYGGWMWLDVYEMFLNDLLAFFNVLQINENYF